MTGDWCCEASRTLLEARMAGNKAMITLQCGNYSNYIGAHFWNLQVLWQPLLLHQSQENIHSCTPLATGVSDSTCSTLRRPALCMVVTETRLEARDRTFWR